MSEGEQYEGVQIEANGVAVEKTFEPEEFPVPAIVFRITSDHDETVGVELVDDVPDTVAVDDLGFHPEYGIEHWTLEADQITFHRGIEPDEEYTTVYGIRATGTDDIEQFLTEPEITTVETDFQAQGAGAEDIDPEEGRDPNAADATQGDTAPTVEELNDSDGSETAVARRTNITSEESTASRAMDARIGKLQSDVADLQAYTGALEVFLNDNGGAELIAELRAEITEMKTRISELETATANNADGLDTLEDGVAEVTTTAETLESEVERLDADLDGVEDDIDDLQALESRLSDLEAGLEEINEWREQLGSVLAATGD